jgi:hypothetical protein
MHHPARPHHTNSNWASKLLALRRDHPKLPHLPSHLHRGPLLNPPIPLRITVLGVELRPQRQPRREPLGLAARVPLDRFDIAADRAEHPGHAPRAERPPRIQRLTIPPRSYSLTAAHLNPINRRLRARDANLDVIVGWRRALPPLVCRIEVLGRQRRRRIAIGQPQDIERRDDSHGQAQQRAENETPRAGTRHGKLAGPRQRLIARVQRAV